MSRPLRIELVGALYHVMARGDARAAIFRGDEDRQAFCASLVRVCERFEWRLLAYCLMDNHYYLGGDASSDALARDAGSQRGLCPGF